MKQVIIFFLLLQTIVLNGQNVIDDVFSASSKVGQEIILEGTIQSLYYAHQSQGKPLFINIDLPHYKNPLTVVIFKDYRMPFYITEDMEGQRVRISGKVLKNGDYKPSIILKDPTQLMMLTELDEG